MKNDAIMYLYKAYLVDKKKKKIVPNKEALKYGILIDKDCGKEVLSSARLNWGMDSYLLNQTFHKSMKKVVDTDLEELIREQIMHYCTTYGFESLGLYRESAVYIPNEKLDLPFLKEDIKLTYIEGITKKELKEKLWSLVTSSIPLSKTTLDCLSDLTEYLEVTKENINEIKNHELKVILYDKLNIVPKENMEFVRYLLYKLIGQTLLIKDENTLIRLEQCDKIIACRLFKAYEKENGLIPLAQIFNRMKPIFLSFKTQKYLIDDLTEEYGLKDEEEELNHIINRISKLSKKHHKPMVPNDLDQFLVWYDKNYKKKNYIELLQKLVEHETIWRIIKLRNYLCLTSTKVIEKVYKIRNGKAWATYKWKPREISDETFAVLDDLIVDRLEKHVEGKKIYLDPHVDLALPQSEKQFVGNIPYSSVIELKRNNLLVGIHWYNTEYDRVDLDLKVITNDYAVGWDADYKEGDRVIFTGDVTDAPKPKGAAEYIYINKNLVDTIFSLKVNNYTREVDHITYELILANKPKKKLVKNFVVDPNDIMVRIPNIPIDKNTVEHSLGNIVIEDMKLKFIFTDLATSNRRSSLDDEVEAIIRNYLFKESKVKCKLKDYLEAAGAKFVKNKEDADMDFSVEALNKNTLIELLKD